MKSLLELFKKDKFAENCGIEIMEVTPGYAKCSMDITEKHLNGIGSLMGGAAFTLADYTFSVAANSHGPLAVTLNAYISFLSACNHGKLTATASEISRTKRTGVYKVSITDGNDEPVAEVTGTCYFKI
jgi:acyl-CoA thioesterase